MGARQRIALTTAVAIATAAVAGPALAAGPTSPGAAASRSHAGGADASVHVAECSTGNRARDRSAVFRGEMTQLPGGARMEMRFGLKQRVRRGEYVRIGAPGLAVPHSSRPGVRRFVYNQRIRRLEKGTAYRAVVVFRWYDAEGTQIARRKVSSRPCRQRGALPNLEVEVLDVRAGPAEETARYVVEVRNSGRATARRSELRITADGAEVDTRRVGRLPPGGSRTVGIVGPPCPVVITAEIDPSGVVREVYELDNGVSYRCP